MATDMTFSGTPEEKLSWAFKVRTNRIWNIFLKKNGPNQASFLFIFVLFSLCKDKYRTNLTINDKSVDGVLGS